VDYLYVCRFSNGHIKVGRSIQPKARIDSHADRVACVGIELIEHHIAECVGQSGRAEAALIDRCTELAAKRNKSEWFEGLDYVDACQVADAEAKEIRGSVDEKNALRKYLDGLERGGIANFASSIGITPVYLSQLAVRQDGRVPSPELCVVIEKATSRVVMRWDLRPNDWHRIWPELIGREDAPHPADTATQTEQVA
jgi:DNA-binding transcriptional regulator YdaS (Cro superfamily)